MVETVIYGNATGIDEAFHFFFDDHDFDETDIGLSLLGQVEVDAIARFKSELASILETNKNGDSAYFLAHPNWSRVKAAAASAHAVPMTTSGK